MGSAAQLHLPVKSIAGDIEDKEGIILAYAALGLPEKNRIAIAETISIALNQYSNFQKMLDIIGDRTTCKACGTEIWFIRTRNNKLIPFTSAGITHFSDCPAAAFFRR